METYYVDWYGPFDIDDITESRLGDKEELYSNVLYMITGRQKYERTDNIQYIGITTNKLTTRFSLHHKKDYVTKNTKVWIGVIENVTATRQDLERAESVLVYFSNPPLNERKTINPPNADCTVISRYYKKDYSVYRRQKLYLSCLDDVLLWSQEEKKLFSAKQLAVCDEE